MRRLHKFILAACLALAALTPQVADAVLFTEYEFPQSPGLTNRTLPDRLRDIKNVKDYGAVGNGVTDDTAAIQAAVDDTSAPYSSADRGIIFFPTGNYLITSSITFELADGIFGIGFKGAHGARITGNINGALLKRSANTPVASVISIESLELYNTHSTGIGVLLHSCIGCVIANCEINAWRGAETYNSQAAVIRETSFIRGTGTKSTSIGVLAGNATSLYAVDVSSYGKGVVHQNAGLIIAGGRFEVNDLAIMVGEDQNGDSFQSSGFHISGLSMEANVISIYLRAAAAGVIAGVSHGAGGGVSVDYGIYVGTVQDVTIAGVSLTAVDGFNQAGIYVNDATRLTFSGVAAGSWSFNTGINSMRLINTNAPLLNVSQLPDTPALGDCLGVTDLTSNTPGGTVTGGGSADGMACWTGSAWRVAY